MAEGDDENDIGSRRICWRCIGEGFLRNEVRQGGEVEQCHYCEEERESTPVDELAGRIQGVFDEHFQRTSPEPEGIDWLLAKEGRWERNGEIVGDLIAETAGLDQQPAEDIRLYLEGASYDPFEAEIGAEGPFDPEAQYEERAVEDHELQESWHFFRRSLESHSRLFNGAAERVLKDVFEGLDQHQTFKGKTLIVEAGPGKTVDALYRARVFQSSEDLKQAMMRPDLELGPPPFRLARAGRMNAQGIAVFYGATVADVALAEIRPPVGSSVLVGRFEIIRHLRLLDIEALQSIFISGSLFDPGFLPALKKRRFLGRLSGMMTQPVMPDDEVFEYLPTQAIAEYLAARNQPALDGIVYPSVQSSKERNIVLFHKAARVRKMDIPAGTKMEAHLWSLYADGPEPDYTVWEEVPTAGAVPGNSNNSALDQFDRIADLMPTDDQFDSREAALEIDTESMDVREVRSVAFETGRHQVTRHRTTRQEPGNPA